jgi:hypothetical protein
VETFRRSECLEKIKAPRLLTVPASVDLALLRREHSVTKRCAWLITGVGDYGASDYRFPQPPTRHEAGFLGPEVPRTYQWGKPYAKRKAIPGLASGASNPVKELRLRAPRRNRCELEFGKMKLVTAGNDKWSEKGGVKSRKPAFRWFNPPAGLGLHTPRSRRGLLARSSADSGGE